MTFRPRKGTPAYPLACLRLLAVAGALALASTEASAERIPRGSDEQTVRLGDERMRVLTYRPRRCDDPSLLLVFHGQGGAKSYRRSARRLADRNCMIAVVPEFDKQRFSSSRYQRGGIVRRGVVQPPAEWTINIVADLARWSRRETGIRDYSLIGHSAGAQFLSRVAAFLPTSARRIVIANPSTHVFPTLAVDAPYGFGGVYPAAQAQAELRRYLVQPVTIFLGEADVGEDDDDLSVTAEAMAQGHSRFERGMNAFRAGKEAAARHGWDFNWRLVRAPGVGHSAGKMFATPQALEALRP